MVIANSSARSTKSTKRDYVARVTQRDTGRRRRRNGGEVRLRLLGRQPRDRLKAWRLHIARPLAQGCRRRHGCQRLRASLPGMRVLDVGSGKGFLLLQRFAWRACQGFEVSRASTFPATGFSAHTMEDVKPFCQVNGFLLRKLRPTRTSISINGRVHQHAAQFVQLRFTCRLAGNRARRSRREIYLRRGVSQRAARKVNLMY